MALAASETAVRSVWHAEISLRFRCDAITRGCSGRNSRQRSQFEEGRRQLQTVADQRASAHPLHPSPGRERDRRWRIRLCFRSSSGVGRATTANGL